MEQIKTYYTRLRGLLAKEDGAVTIDWVVLTAAIVMLGMAAAFAVGANIPGIANQISSTVAGQDVG